MSNLSSECNAISTEKGQGRKRPRKDSAGGRRTVTPLVAPYSLQLHAAGELVYRARLFAVKLYNHMCPPWYCGPPLYSDSSEEDSYDDDDKSDDDDDDSDSDSDSDGDDSDNYDDKRPTPPQKTLEAQEVDDRQKAWFAYFKKLPSVVK
jgi:hypothetical protein